MLPGKPNLDRRILLTYLSLLVLVLFGAAAWATVVLSSSNAGVGGVIAVLAVIYGVAMGRLREKRLRWLGMASVLVILIILTGRAGVGHSYQFAWLFPFIAGLILARAEWPWWRERNDGKQATCLSVAMRRIGKASDTRRPSPPCGVSESRDQSTTGADMSTTAPDSRRSARRKRSQALVVLAVVVLVPLLAFIVAPAVLKTYDATNRVHPICAVSSAHSGTDSSRSLKGVGSSTAQVVFETTDCGTLVLKWGVSRANQERIAHEVLPGENYQFDVGAGSYRLHGFLNAVRQAVYVRTFERVSNE